MSKDHQLNIIKIINKDIKERYERYQSNNMVVNDTNIYQKMKNKSLLNIDKKYYKMRKNALL